MADTVPCSFFSPPRMVSAPVTFQSLTFHLEHKVIWMKLTISAMLYEIAGLKTRCRFWDHVKNTVAVSFFGTFTFIIISVFCTLWRKWFGTAHHYTLMKQLCSENLEQGPMTVRITQGTFFSSLSINARLWRNGEAELSSDKTGISMSDGRCYVSRHSCGRKKKSYALVLKHSYLGRAKSQDV